MLARIMVVEDDPSARSALAELLRLWGYQADTACDGLDALDKLTGSGPMVVISDLQMPGLSGIELIKTIRRSSPQVSCIAVTGNDGMERAALVSGLGIVDLLEKPVDLLRLRQDLQKCLETRGVSNQKPA